MLFYNLNLTEFYINFENNVIYYLKLILNLFI
jgi:hypothetical protein